MFDCAPCTTFWPSSFCSFNPAIDRDILGYERESIFSAPVCADGVVVAVALFVNKMGQTRFTVEDEDTFAVYANFAGLYAVFHIF